jgi:hypothetical protein
MIRLLKNRYALATVITTLIILVVAVLLVGVVTYFAVNVVSTRVQQESLSVVQAHIWVTPAGVAEGALMITNTGGRDVVISQIQVRGQQCPMSDIFYKEYAIAPNSSLPYQSTINTTTYASASSLIDLVLPSGNTTVVYISSPDSVSINDVGLTIGFTVLSAQAVYYKETNVQAAP